MKSDDTLFGTLGDDRHTSLYQTFVHAKYQIRNSKEHLTELMLSICKHKGDTDLIIIWHISLCRQHANEIVAYTQLTFYLEYPRAEIVIEHLSPFEAHAHLCLIKNTYTYILHTCIYIFWEHGHVIYI